MEKILTQDNMSTLLTQLKTKMDARYAPISSTTLGYEEGTFTPVFKNAAGTTVASATNNSMICYYRKIGKICIIHISTNANVPIKKISGLPFSVAANYCGIGGAVRLSKISETINPEITITPLRLSGTTLITPGAADLASVPGYITTIDGVYPTA